MLEGARRVGKSTLAQEFAQSKYKSHLVIDESVASEKKKTGDSTGLRPLFKKTSRGSTRAVGLLPACRSR